MTRQSSGRPHLGAPCPPAPAAGPNSPPTPSPCPGSHEEKEVQRRTVREGRSHAVTVRAGVRAELETVAWPRPPGHPSPQRSDRQLPPHGSFQTPTAKSSPLLLFFCLPGFLTLSCFLVNHPRDFFANPRECASLGHFLFFFLLNQTLLSKTADEALCLPPGKIFHEF